MYNPYSLKGKTVLVTGASSGIGRATAIECSRLGANIVLNGRREEALKETLGMLEGDSSNHSYIVADLATQDGIDKLVKEMPLVNGVALNAGVSKFVPILFINETELESLFRVNAFSPILLLKNIVKKKKIAPPASVVFTASISGNGNISPAISIYGASKSALATFMKYAALELAPKGIRCNSVNPGRIETPLIANRAISEEDKKTDQQRYPLKRYGKPEEVAWAIAYLLSDASAWTTGTSLTVDGGRSLV